MNLANLWVDPCWNNILWTWKWFFQKIMTLLWVSCSSNLAKFLLLWPTFDQGKYGCLQVFHKQPTCEMCIKCVLLPSQVGVAHFLNVFLVVSSQKNTALSLKNRKWIFYTSKLKTPKGNIVCHAKINKCEKYGLIWT